MNRTVSVSMTLLVLTSVLLLCSSVALFIMKENEIEKRIVLEKEVLDKTKEADTLSEELAMLRSELTSVREAKAKVDLELVIKESEIQNYKDKFNMLTLEHGSKDNEMEGVREQSQMWEQRFSRLEGEFNQLQLAKEGLEDKLKNIMDSQVKLKTIIVEPEDEHTLSSIPPQDTASIATYETYENPYQRSRTRERKKKKTIEGEVLAVNKEYEFLVISVGATSGLGVNSDISIYRSNELVAMGKVEKLYENISAAIANDKGQLSNIKVGDTVVATVREGLGDGNL